MLLALSALLIYGRSPSLRRLLIRAQGWWLIVVAFTSLASVTSVARFAFYIALIALILLPVVQLERGRIRRSLKSLLAGATRPVAVLRTGAHTTPYQVVRMRRRLLIFASGGVALAIIVPAMSFAAVQDRATALAGYRSVMQDNRVDAGWKGSITECVAGTESSASLAATLRTINTLRAFAGIGAVTFDDQLNGKALAAALMMRAGNQLSHTPGLGWPCYSVQGAEGAGGSNLFLGRSGADAMVGYVDDEGIDSLGHRRWLLNPESTVFGSGSTGTTNALYVVTDSTAPSQSWAWPPAGWVPWQWIFKDWSLAIASTLDQIVRFEDPRVSVTIDGVPAAVSQVTTLGGGYGSGQTLKWQVAVGQRPTDADHTIQVTVLGAVANGQPVPISWKISAFQPDPPPPRFTRGPRIRRPHGAGSRVRAGQRLVASAKVSGGTVTRYRWLRDGRTIRGATRSSYLVRRADRRHRLAVRLTATATAGRATTVRASPAVRIRG